MEKRTGNLSYEIATLRNDKKSDRKKGVAPFFFTMRLLCLARNDTIVLKSKVLYVEQKDCLC